MAPAGMKAQTSSTHSSQHMKRLSVCCVLQCRRGVSGALWSVFTQTHLALDNLEVEANGGTDPLMMNLR